ncbi:MAG: cupin domain-containing protein [Chloroflexota bacterium]
MSNLVDIDTVPPIDVWGDVVRVRRVEGDRITLALVELAPNAVVPEHQHGAEQLGMVVTGSIRMTVDGETRELGPGGTWRITSDVAHDAVAGSDGAMVIDVFTPIRSDWDRFEPQEPQAAPWPVRR